MMGEDSDRFLSEDELDKKIRRVQNLLGLRRVSVVSKDFNKLKQLLQRYLSIKHQRQQPSHAGNSSNNNQKNDNASHSKAFNNVSPTNDSISMVARCRRIRNAERIPDEKIPVADDPWRSISVEKPGVFKPARNILKTLDKREVFLSQTSSEEAERILRPRENVQKRKEITSFTLQGQMKRKIATFIDLDKDDKSLDEEGFSVSNREMETKIFYPAKDDPDCVEIDYSDMQCLSPFSYLTSPVMNYYIQYLRRHYLNSSKRANDYHFFNTYFYRKLDEALHNQTDKKDCKSLTKLRRWLKGLNIFKRTYLFLPVHFRLHWSLVIICMPTGNGLSEPIILHMDSLGIHSSNAIFSNIKSFLVSEWEHIKQEEKTTDLEIVESLRRTSVDNIHIKKVQVPQQDNDYDCGLFVLYFMQRFIQDARPWFKMDDLHMFGRQWFRPDEASNLRSDIRASLAEHFANQYH